MEVTFTHGPKLERSGMTIKPVFAWYDLWIGAFWDRKARKLYLMIPMVGIVIQFKAKSK